MIIDTFLGALFGENGDAKAQARLMHAAQLEQSRVYATASVHSIVAQSAELRAMYAAAESRAIILREKLEAVRPYLVAAAKGSSLQAKGDLAALDAVLRSTKP